MPKPIGDAFPIPPDRLPRIVGGYWAKDSREPAVEQEHVFLEVRPVGRRGTVAIEVRLATPLWESDRNSVPRRVALTFFADYAILQQFAHAVASLAARTADEAVLVSDVTSV